MPIGPKTMPEQREPVSDREDDILKSGQQAVGQAYRGAGQAVGTAQNAVGTAQNAVGKAKRIKNAIGGGGAGNKAVNGGKKTYRVANNAVNSARKVKTGAGKGVQAAGKGMEYAGKGAKAAGTGLKATGTAANAVPIVGNAAGAVMGGAGTLLNGAGAAAETAGKGIQNLGRAITSKIPGVGQVSKIMSIKNLPKNLFSLVKTLVFNKFTKVIVIALLIGIVFFESSLELLKEMAVDTWDSLVSSFSTQIAMANGSKSLQGGGGSVASLSEDDFQALLKALKDAKLPDEQVDSEEAEDRQDILNEVSQDEERERIKTYLEAERDSILKAPGAGQSTFQSLWAIITGKPPESNRLISSNQASDFNIGRISSTMIDIVPDMIKPAMKDAQAKIQKKILGKLLEIDPQKTIQSGDKIKTLMDKQGTYSYERVEVQTDKGTKIVVREDCDPPKDYDLKDSVFRMLDTYALQWRLLYLIDKAIDEDEFENFEEKSDTKKKIETELIWNTANSFMPKFKVKRHLNISITSHFDSRDLGRIEVKFVPVYTLEKVDVWNKTIESSNTDVKTTLDAKAGTSIISFATSPETKITNKNELKDANGKGSLDRLFQDEFGINTSVDIGRILEVSSSAPGFSKARRDLATTFGIKLDSYSLAMGGGFIANIDELISKKGDTATVKMIQSVIETINRELPAAGIPAPVYVAQILIEIGWNLSSIPGTNNLTNLSAVPHAQNAVYYPVEGGPSWWTGYPSYEASVGGYAERIKSVWPKAIDAANSQGWYAYAQALQAGPKYCGDKNADIYADTIAKYINDYHLVADQATGIISVGGEAGWPLGGSYRIITSPYGPRWGEHHSGVDFKANQGTPVYAFKNGKVISVVSLAGSYGYHIKIEHEDGMLTIYAHLTNQSSLVQVGQQVTAGQQIGLSGNTGRSTGPHLHFEIRVGGKDINPEPYLTKPYTYE